MEKESSSTSPKRQRSSSDPMSVIPMERDFTQGFHEKMRRAGATNTIFGHRDCPVCFENLDNSNFVQVLPCGHSICNLCLMKLFQNNSNNKCFCREVIANVFSEIHQHETIFQFKLRQEPPTISLFHSLVLPSMPPLEVALPVNNVDEFICFFKTYIINGEKYGNIILMPKKAFIPNNSDVLLIIDNSPSMQTRMPLIKEAAIEQIKNLKSGQRLSVLLFNSVSKHIFGMQPVTPENINYLIDLIRDIRLTGGTNYNEPFKHSVEIFRQADFEHPSHSHRKKMIVFLSDGEPQQAPDLTILDTLDSMYPLAHRNIISIGNDVDAEEHLIPLLRGRSVDLGQYYHCGNIENFKHIMAQIHGENTDMYSSQIKINFNNLTPITNNIGLELTFPVLNYGNSINIPFKMNNNDEPFGLSYSMNLVDGTVKSGIFVEDSESILPDALTILFTKNKLITREINLIINNDSLECSVKCAQLILLKASINEEYYGIYYHEIINNLNTLIENLTDLEYGDFESQNTISQIRQMSNSDSVMSPLARQTSTTLSQAI